MNLHRVPTRRAASPCLPSTDYRGCGNRGDSGCAAPAAPARSSRKRPSWLRHRAAGLDRKWQPRGLEHHGVAPHPGAGLRAAGRRGHRAGPCWPAQPSAPPESSSPVIAVMPARPPPTRPEPDGWKSNRWRPTPPPSASVSSRSPARHPATTPGRNTCDHPGLAVVPALRPTAVPAGERRVDRAGVAGGAECFGERSR